LTPTATKNQHLLAKYDLLHKITYTQETSAVIPTTFTNCIALQYVSKLLYRIIKNERLNWWWAY